MDDVVTFRRSDSVVESMALHTFYFFFFPPPKYIFYSLPGLSQLSGLRAWTFLLEAQNSNDAWDKISAQSTGEGCEMNIYYVLVDEDGVIVDRKKYVIDIRGETERGEVFRGRGDNIFACPNQLSCAESSFVNLEMHHKPGPSN